MASKNAADEISERKRISIPKADESALQWWAVQRDPALSIRTLIRAEIERSGYVDAVYKPVTQLPRRGRPPGSGADFDTDAGTTTDTPSATVIAITAAPASPAPTAQVAPDVDTEPVRSQASPSAIDMLMNG